METQASELEMEDNRENIVKTYDDVVFKEEIV